MIYEHTLPHRAECLAVFDQKRHDPRAPPSLIHTISPQVTLFVSQDEKVLKGKCLADVEEVKQKRQKH